MFAHFLIGDVQPYFPVPCVLSVQQFWTKHSMAPMPHAHYSPDLAPSAFFCLFLQMKKVLKGKYFADTEEVKQKMAEALKGIKIDEFKNCFEQ